MGQLFTFNIQARQGQARRATFHTAHGPIETPCFAPVGTQATVKTLEPRDLHQAGCDLILANAYHLYLRPGHRLIQAMGGLHQFMHWSGPILTDSGGFQVFSLSHRRTFDEDGVSFQSHLDGSWHKYTPALAMEIQESLGSDIAMVLDECAPPHDRKYMLDSLERTHRWAAECRTVHTCREQALFGIVQGGIHEDLRLASARFLSEFDFPGLAIGGLAVGETKAEMYQTLAFTCPALPETKPRYLMGVGAPEDIMEAVQLGVDIFDCVMPTRIARNGSVFHPNGRLNLRNAIHATDEAPVQYDCSCYTCRHFSRAYLHHLTRCKEISGLRLCTIHNVTFMQNLMKTIRHAIESQTWQEFRQNFHARYRIPDQTARHIQRSLQQRGKVNRSLMDRNS